MRSRSIRTTGTPKEAAIAATDKPPEPAPITQRSGFSTSLKGERSAESSSVRMLGRRRRGLRHRRVRRPAAPVADDDRDQGHDAERREGGEDLRREDATKGRDRRRNPSARRSCRPWNAAFWAAMTLSSPAPAIAKAKVAGRMPIMVAKAKVFGPDAEKRRREVRQPERHDGQEAQEEKVGEGVLAEPVGELLQLRPGLAGEDIADRGAGDEEDQTAPSVAETDATAPPKSQPNRKPPKIVRNTAPGTESATATT